jgi:hypothetical protein
VKFGARNPNWIDGRDKDKYPVKFNFQLKKGIRRRDNFTCKKCGVKEAHLVGYFKRLDVHHIDYNKQNLDPMNLITLCRSCNGQVNKDRLFWMSYFSSLLEN